MSNIAKSFCNSSKRKDVKYSTPRALVKDMINAMNDYWKSGDSALDPCAGDKRFYNEFPDFLTKDYCELDEGKDVYQYDKQVDWIVGNPPFSKLRKRWVQSFKVAKKGIFYIQPLTTPCNRPLVESSDKGWFYDNGFYVEKIWLTTVKEWFGFPVLLMLVLKGQRIEKINTMYVVDKDDLMQGEEHENKHWQSSLK